MNIINQTQRKMPSDKYGIAKAFNTAAHTYDQSSLLQREIGKRLIERLVNLQEIFPKTATIASILDLGGGTGYFSQQLQSEFPFASITNVDIAYAMLKRAKAKNASPNIYLLCADAENLPFHSSCFDLIFSNCTLQWCNHYKYLFSTLFTLLKENGLFFFSTFGPDTLRELQMSFKTVDDEPHVNQFYDMHLLGDALVRAKFSYPVVDREIITLFYPNVMDLLKELKHMGANHVLKTSDSPQGLLTPKKLNKMCEAYESYRNEENMIPASFEVIYGFAKR